MQKSQNNLLHENGDDTTIELEEMSEEEKFFKNFNLIQLDYKDPSTEGNFIKIFEEEIPFEIRMEDESAPNDSIFAKLFFKILVSGLNNQINIVKIEVFYNKDLFFYFKAEINIEIFNELKQTQQLFKNFGDFPNIIMKYLYLVLNESDKYFGVFNIYKNQNVKMEIIQNLNYKFAEILMVNFVRINNDLDIRRQIIYNFNTLRKKYQMVIKRVGIINEVLKDSSPELIPEIKKEVTKIKIDTSIRDKPLLKDS